MQSPKRCVLKYQEDGALDENRTMDNVQKHNICTNVPSSQTFRPYDPALLNVRSVQVFILSFCSFSTKLDEDCYNTQYNGSLWV
jgi:hypothetical protein